MTAGLKLVANVSLLFTEVPYLQRFSRAAKAGFTAVETWWPWAEAVPAAHEVDAFVRAINDAGVALTGLNLFAGDVPGGERGIVAHPGRRREFAANLDVVAAIAERTGCPAFNALYGQRTPGGDPAREDAVAREQLGAAVRKLPGTVLVEALGRGLNGAYPLETAKDAVDVVTRVRADTGAENIGLLFDTFHLTVSGDDLIEVIDEYAGLIAHVQFADAPGRGQPGSGVIDFAGVVERLWGAGYRGAVAAEYKPAGLSEESLGWVGGVSRLRW